MDARTRRKMSMLVKEARLGNNITQSITNKYNWMNIQTADKYEGDLTVRMKKWGL